jgi:hypothetical protein
MMNDQDRRRFDAFVRIVQFGVESATDFPAGSIGKVQFEEIAAVVELLNELAANKAVSVGEARFAFVGKGSARENLREELSDIVTTARSMV